jgi:hypothetical protein
MSPFVALRDRPTMRRGGSYWGQTGHASFFPARRFVAHFGHLPSAKVADDQRTALFRNPIAAEDGANPNGKAHFLAQSE